MEHEHQNILLILKYELASKASGINERAAEDEIKKVKRGIGDSKIQS